ncbi:MULTISPECIES: SH3 domain-containing protein [Streptomyces]|uniref:SH3 domain-containing protein n=1 Tax=Streptomyces TaxID=1883 RepID=UPI00210B3577|nr:SH3 domain-containing protein [Streptomyces longispororuber]MCQ4212568.1 SH3 domain-containing protein [Streptomyces longispororuber]
MRRTTPAALAAATLLTGGVLAVTAAVPASANSGGDDVVWGTVVSRSDLNLRSGPSTSDAVVYRMAPGSVDRIECATGGSTVHGNSTWYWFTGAHGWASAAYVDTGGRSVPSCDGSSVPCPPDGQQQGGSPSGWWFRSDYRVEFGVTY